MNNNMSNTERLAFLAKKFNSRNTNMNGLEVMEHYKALHPVTDEPSCIPFTEMYKALVKLATGVEARPIRTSWSVR
jgi:hypothetical protein